MGSDAFLSLWDRHLADFCADELMRDGAEQALFGRLKPYPRATALLVEHASRSPDYRHRKAAALLAGSLEDAPPELLDRLFEQESERNAMASPESTEPLCCQSVVEDLVMAASRWCHQEATRDAGLALLRKIVERTLVGEYWGSAGFALTTLCRYQSDGSEELLRLFRDFAAASPPDHPLRPNLVAEREFARGLLARSPEILNAVEVRLGQEQATGASVEFDPETEATVVAWITAARLLG